MIDQYGQHPDGPYELSRAARREQSRKIAQQNPVHAKVLEDLKNELLIVFLRRLGGKASIPVVEIDATEGIGLAFRVDEKKVFHFELKNVPLGEAK